MRARRSHVEPVSFRPFVAWVARLPFLLLLLVFLAPDNVDHGEDDDPDAIDKMPIQRKHADASRLFRAETACQPEHENGEEHDQTCGDVKSVQTNQGVVSRSKEVRGDLQPVFVDQTVPFAARAVKKEGAQNDRERPQTQESASAILFKELSSEVDCETAGPQADREEDGDLQDLARRWSCEALPHVIEIGNDENREDGRLGDDE